MHASGTGGNSAESDAHGYFKMAAENFEYIEAILKKLVTADLVTQDQAINAGIAAMRRELNRNSGYLTDITEMLAVIHGMKPGQTDVSGVQRALMKRHVEGPIQVIYELAKSTENTILLELFERRRAIMRQFDRQHSD